jgi:hypothetical protein
MCLLFFNYTTAVYSVQIIISCLSAKAHEAAVENFLSVAPNFDKKKNAIPITVLRCLSRGLNASPLVNLHASKLRTCALKARFAQCFVVEEPVQIFPGGLNQTEFLDAIKRVVAHVNFAAFRDNLVLKHFANGNRRTDAVILISPLTTVLAAFIGSGSPLLLRFPAAYSVCHLRTSATSSKINALYP